jgi:NADH pyrophosphatase NudC (nudix superfamily)
MYYNKAVRLILLYVHVQILLFYCFLLQGGWENDETVEQAAAREAIEEAGVRGDIVVRYL